MFLSYENVKLALTKALGGSNFLRTIIRAALDLDYIVEINTSHDKIHHGLMYTICDVSDVLNVDQYADYLFIAPEGDMYFHGFLSAYSTGEHTIEVWEDVTYTTEGTALSLINRNREVANSMTAVYKNPTGVSLVGATKLVCGRYGSGKAAPGESRATNEMILKPGSVYYFKATSKANGSYITTNMEGYIHSSDI